MADEESSKLYTFNEVYYKLYIFNKQERLEDWEPGGSTPSSTIVLMLLQVGHRLPSCYLTSEYEEVSSDRYRYTLYPDLDITGTVVRTLPYWDGRDGSTDIISSEESSAEFKTSFGNVNSTEYDGTTTPTCDGALALLAYKEGDCLSDCGTDYIFFPIDDEYSHKFVAEYSLLYRDDRRHKFIQTKVLLLTKFPSDIVHNIMEWTSICM